MQAHIEPLPTPPHQGGTGITTHNTHCQGLSPEKPLTSRVRNLQDKHIHLKRRPTRRIPSTTDKFNITIDGTFTNTASGRINYIRTILRGTSLR